MAGRSVSRASLGRVAQLGELYNIRTDAFLKDSLFISKLEDNMVDRFDIAETVIEVAASNSLREKCKNLCVEDELQLSVTAGMVNLGGSGAYLLDEPKSARTQSMGLIYKLKTISEEVILSQSRDITDIAKLYDTDPEATHVVVGIDWGAQCTITYECENTENEDVTKVRGEMKVKLEELKDVLNAKLEPGVYLEDNEREDESRKLFLKYRADILTTDNYIPVTYEEAAGLVRNLSALVSSTNNGNGVPVIYYLMGLQAVRKRFRVKADEKVIHKEIDECTFKKCAQAFEKVQETCQRVDNIKHDMNLNGEFISHDALRSIAEISVKVTMQKSHFQCNLQKVVKSVRSGKEELISLEEFLDDVIKPEEIETSKYEEEFEPYLKKIKLIRSMLNEGIKYIGKKAEFVKDAKENTFVFYIPKGADREVVEKNVEFLIRLSSTCDDSYEFVVVDQEIVVSHIWPGRVKTPTIEKYENGTCTSEDLYEEEGQYLKECMIQIVNPRQPTVTAMESTFAKIRCPNALAGEGTCAGDPSEWKCSECKQVVEYCTTSKLFHCRCGEANPSDSLFRCADPHHGMNFIKYPKDLFNEDLSKLKPMKEMNILVLGETGVGKSTWINGIQNYLSFDNLNEAMYSQDFPVLIPSSFTLTQDGVQKKIHIGIEDPNEVQETGKSATREPRTYVFTVGDRRLRFIDTPGIGDSDGVKQDEINMNNILTHLTLYTEIHAICILLKPNNARISVSFKFCIQELLVQLHNAAKNNIVFCFTNARQTFYQPGDTLPALNKELERKNVGIQATKDKYFCFDNEPFRFLSCIKNGVSFGEGEIATYSSSWDKSVDETLRLFKYIECELKPHKVRETLGMNEARRIIIAMSKPLAEVAKTINHNVDAARETKTKIRQADTEMNSLRVDLKFKGYDLARNELGFNRTVCAAPKCVKYVQVGQARVQNTVYETICHSRCRVRGVLSETTGNPKLYKCSAMDEDGYCFYCGHSYKRHMHLTYEIVLKEKEFLSTQVQDQINAIRDMKSKKEAIIGEINKKVEDLKAEQAIIMKTAAKFGSFLKDNALIPYNDAVDEYLEMCIIQEEAKPAPNRKEGVLEDMRKMKDEYDKQREILDNAVADGASENIKTPEQVRKLQEDLFKLKHFGATLKTLCEENSIMHRAKKISIEERILPPTKRAPRGWENVRRTFRSLGVFSEP